MSAQSILCTARVARFSRNEMALAYYYANEGLPFGRVANALNAVRVLEGRSPELLCIGDPRSSLPCSIQSGRLTVDEGTLVIDCGSDVSTNCLVDVKVDRGPDVSIGSVFVTPHRNGPLSVAMDATSLYVTLQSNAVSHVRRYVCSASKRDARLRNLMWTRRIARIATHVDGACSGDRLLDSAEQAEGVIDAVDRYEPNSATDMRAIETMNTIATSALAKVHSELCDLYVRMATNGVGHPPQLWNVSSDMHEQICDVPCPYCANPTHVFCHRALDDERCARYCHACGLIYAGARQSMFVALETFGIWTRGVHPVTLTFAAQGPVAGAFVLEALLRGRNVSVGASVMNTADTVTLAGNIDVPRDYRHGTYYLGAVAALDGGADYWRRPVVLDPPTMLTTES
jgi:hypothetical protein